MDCPVVCFSIIMGYLIFYEGPTDFCSFTCRDVVSLFAYSLTIHSHSFLSLDIVNVEALSLQCKSTP